MELDWTTFILEIINFLILVWILQHFLYKPVLNIIARRKSDIDRTLLEAGTKQNQAENLKEQYEKRLVDWEKEKLVAREAFQDEMNAERLRQMTALQKSLQEEREKSRIIDQRNLADQQRKLNEEAIEKGARFASRFLTRFSSIEFESRLIKLICEDLPKLTGEQTERIRKAFEDDRNSKIRITSAFPVSDELKEALVKSLSELIGSKPVYEFNQEPALLTGLRINLGSWVLQANLQEELKFFSEMEYRAIS
ncbi:MAG: F0F1 ATP synthase subunit delta [Nitrospiria bacterium]